MQQLEGEEYATFVRLVREETAILNENDVAVSPPSRWSFLRFTNHETEQIAFLCLEQKGEVSRPETQFDLFLIEKAVTQGNPGKPFYWLNKAARNQYPYAQYMMAKCIIRYHGNHQNGPPEIAEEDSLERYRWWLEQAAAAGVPKAQYELGRLHTGDLKDFWGDAATDLREGVRWLSRAATQTGNSLVKDMSAAKLGNMYFEGVRVEKNYETAFYWFSQVSYERATKSCSPFGWVGKRLGEMYEAGLGVERDLSKAKLYSAVNMVCP